VLAIARLDGFGSRSDDAGMDESQDRAEALRLKSARSRDSRRRVPEAGPRRIRRSYWSEQIRPSEPL
jgi:hypothetical protein